MLEHPAYSDAWPAFDIPAPPTGGGWVRDIHGGWSCYVEQGRYGHAAKKATWLYAVNCELPTLRWGHVPDQEVKAWVSWCGNNTRGSPRGSRPRVGHAHSKATPLAFRDVLLGMARSVRRAP